MVVVMDAEATEADADNVVSLVREAGGEAFVSRGVSRTIIGLSGDIDHLATLNLPAQPGVSDVVRISVPYKLVSREHRRERSVIRVAGVPIGPDTLTVIAGPCAVETPEQTLQSALMAKAAGASLLRGGAYKPRSSPYAFQGLGEAGLRILADVREATGLPIVTEVVDPGDVDLVASYADMLQVGTRNMQNFPLLQAVGRAGRPVMLKRGMSATIEEWLMAAEYIAQRALRVRVNVDDDAVGANRDRGAGQRQDQVPATARMRRVHDHRQVGQPLRDRDGADIQGVARRLLERPDAALAQHDVQVAALRDVLGGHQPFFDRRAHAALEHDRLSGAADRLQQREVLHVAGADLQHVRVRGDQVYVGRVDDLGHDRQPGLGAHLGEDLQAILPETLERVRG